MRKWKEFSNNLEEYYDLSGQSYARIMSNASVISYNASDVIKDKEEFWGYCERELLSDLLLSKQVYIYMIATEKVMNVNSKVEKYKKCWKKISDTFDLNGIMLGREIEHRINGITYFSSIGRIDITNLSNILRIIDVKKNYYILFISRNNYINKDEDYENFILQFVSLNNYHEIDYANVFNLCNRNEDIVCRYGIDSTGIELAFIARKEILKHYFKKEILSFNS